MVGNERAGMKGGSELGRPEKPKKRTGLSNQEAIEPGRPEPTGKKVRQTRERDKNCPRSGGRSSSRSRMKGRRDRDTLGQKKRSDRRSTARGAQQLGSNKRRQGVEQGERIATEKGVSSGKHTECADR